MQLSRDHIRSWDDLANAFLAQYKHMVDEAPDRMTLLNIEKKATESFREYAQRWRDFASQVQPPLTERETTKIFMNSLKGIYHDKMLGNAMKNFTDMVVSGELIESSIKNGLVEDNSGSKKTGSAKKKRRSLSCPCGFSVELCSLFILPRLCTILPIYQQCGP